MKLDIENAITPLIRELEGKWLEVTKEQIECADGRKDRLNPICKKSSCLYLACSDDDSILYVGETSISIKRRFISDGSGSHKTACGNWYPRMTKVKFVTFEEQDLPDMHRKLFEQALSIHYKPEFYANRT
ncbi:hypothetical protein ACEUDN_21690 [Aeromonas hydrophila]|uniref:hypothetical protein n=1 Tax=Aeromonas hydrophila TaxID=644 RepID=UPI0038D220C6